MSANANDPPVRMVRDAQGRLMAIPMDAPLPPGAVPARAFAGSPPARVGEEAGASVGGIAPAPIASRSGDGLSLPSRTAGGEEERNRTLPQVESRSEELQEVVGFVPHWLVRWGTLVVFGVIAVLLAVSWVVRYPVVVTGRATFTTPAPPVRLSARIAGEIDTLFISDGVPVRRGQVIAVLRNPADYGAVSRLSAALNGFDPADEADAGLFGREPALGDLQGAYSAFLQALADLRAFRAAPYDDGRIGQLMSQVQGQETLRENAGDQLLLIQEQLRIAERELGRNRELAARELIAHQEMEEAEAEYLQKRVALESARQTLTSADIQLAGQTGALLDLQQRRDDMRREYVLAVRSAYDALCSRIDAWRQEHLIAAPIAGDVSLYRPLTRGQYVAAGEPLLAVVPAGGNAVARVEVPQAASGKVRVGQPVIVRVDGYSAAKFGTVRGRVERISLVPDHAAEDEPRYLLHVSLPAGMQTSFGQRLSFRQEMRGSAAVITEDARLFDRVFQRLGSLRNAVGAN